MYFGLAYLHGQIFGKLLRIKPYLGTQQNTPTACFYLLHKATPTILKSFVELKVPLRLNGCLIQLIKKRVSGSCFEF